MISAADAIAAARGARQRFLSQGPTRVEFPAWQLPDGSPFVCFVWPLTIQEEDRILAARRAGVRAGRSGDYDEILATVAVRACNEDGSPIFSEAQVEELRRAVNAEDIRALFQQINAADPRPEEVEKN